MSGSRSGWTARGGRERAPWGSRPPWRSFRTALAAGLALAMPACGTDEAGAGGPVVVLASANLTGALEELANRFERERGRRLALSFGSTGTLFQQIRRGAPADLFFSADEAPLDALVEDGRVDASSRTVYAVGRLAVVVPRGATPAADLAGLADPRFGVVAIANPDHAPYGRAASEALRAAGVWDVVGPRAVLGESVAHALQFVRTGNADAGIVALGLVADASGAKLPHRVVDAALHAPLRQVAGVLTGAARAREARAFLDFVGSDVGRAVLAAYGYESPPEEG